MRDTVLWNIAAMGKYVWEISEKKDNIWVKWVHMVYIKEADWNSLAPKYDSSWYLRKICEVRDKISPLVDLDAMDKYSIKQVYVSLRMRYKVEMEYLHLGKNCNP